MSSTKSSETAEKTRKKIWVLCFEYAGIAKVGGLGEVSANQCRSLIHEPELDLHVFMPSHGRHLQLKEKLHLQPLTEKNGQKIVLKGHFDPYYFGVSHEMTVDRSFTKFQSFTDVGYFEIEVWKGVIEDVPIYLFVGVNPIASKILNDVEVYGWETLNAKLGLFSHAIREYTRYCIFKAPELLPNIVHIHDHHPVAALLCCRQEMNLIGKDIRSIITMHLLTWPRRELEFFWKSGVNNEPMLIQMGVYRVWRTMRQLYDEIKSYPTEYPTLEKIGCTIADRVIAVSENFMNSDIIPNCGGNIIKWKSDFIWNGCDWDYQVNLKSVFSKYQSLLNGQQLDTIHSWDFRKILVEKIIGNLPPGEPSIPSKEIRALIQAEFNFPPYHPNCTVDAFNSDGPLILITGRVSPQKGIENIFLACPAIIEKFPNVRFLFLMVPSSYSSDDLRNYMNFARNYPQNVRFLFGVAGSIYTLAYLAADVYCCPSRWEPFGIVALEAMASRLPVVATYVGGLMESVVHVEYFPEKGTGLLCPNNDPEALKYALLSMISTMQIAEMKSKNPNLTLPDIHSLLNNIVHPNLKSKVEKNLLFGEQIRDQALHRVEELFRWRKTSEKLKDIYLSLNY